MKAVAAGTDLHATRVRDLESTSVVWCDASAPVDEVASQMLGHYIRHVLVENGGRLTGVVSARDLLGAYTTG